MLEVNAVNDTVCAANELVNVNTVESNPSNSSALEAYDAEATEPDSVMLPDAIILPVTVSEPDIVGELSIILFIFILICHLKMLDKQLLPLQ